MLTIYYSFIRKEVHEFLMSNYRYELSSDFQNRILRYKNWSDAQLSLLGRMMLFDILKKKYRLHMTDNDIRFTKNKKPFFEDAPINFNISHAHHISICGVTEDGEIGIDIEKIQPVKIEDLGFCLTPNEKKKINESMNKDQLIIDIWTRKESLIKLIGKGLTIPLSEIETQSAEDNDTLLYNGQNFNIKKIYIADDYCCYVCSELPIKDISINEFKN
ncbi:MULTISPECIES: 4'-phosphopantetheinyl transferase family protein [Chryseobacterium]|nr:MULTISPECIES: 4'-phosphopantetheinyl transferase superfamily protein [Chryseobacterium]QWA40721.1 4'-phosphopantetheinyl transferase superfamily protein [Chryseobacterium sp. ZHDP1]